MFKVIERVRVIKASWASWGTSWGVPGALYRTKTTDSIESLSHLKIYDSYKK